MLLVIQLTNIYRLEAIKSIVYQYPRVPANKSLAPSFRLYPETCSCHLRQYSEICPEIWEFGFPYILRSVYVALAVGFAHET